MDILEYIASDIAETFECGWCKEFELCGRDGDAPVDPSEYTYFREDLAGYDEDGIPICIYCASEA